MIKKFSSAVLKNRIHIVIATILLSLVLGYQMTNLKVNSDILSYLPKDDPAVQLFNKVGEEFGGNSLAFIALESDDIFTHETIKHINHLTEQFKLVDGVTEVTSLTNILDIKKTNDGLEVGKLIDENNLPQTAEELDHLRRYALSKDLYVGRIVSSDAKAALIICRIKQSADRLAVARELKQITEQAKLPEKVYFSGIPFQMIELTDLIFKDLKTLVPIVSALVGITLILSFGTLRGVALPLLTVLMSMIWVLGSMSILGIPLTVISDIIPVILIAVGSAYTIHLISRYDEDVRSGNGNAEQLAKSLSEVSVPILLAALTTMVGFLSFIFGSYLTMIREFGLFSALGVLFALIISVTFVPAVLSLLRDEKGGQTGFIENAAFVAKFMDRVAKFVFRHERLIVIGTIIVIIISILGIPRIDRRVNMVDYFKPGASIRTAQELMEKKFGGSIPITIFVQGDLQNPFVLKEMWRMGKFLESLSDVHNAQSASSLIAEMHEVMNDQKTIPDSRDKVTNLWFFLEGEEIMDQLVNVDKTEGVIQATLGTVDTKRGRFVIDAIENYINTLDTNLIVMNFSSDNSLSQADRKILTEYKAKRAAQLIQWGARKRYPQSVIDENEVANVLMQTGYQFNGQEGSKPSGRIENSIAQLVPVFPGELQRDPSFLNEVRDAIADFQQQNVAIPVRVYEELSFGKQHPDDPEHLHFSFRQTGMGLIYQHLDSSIMRSQFQSLVIAIVLVLILLSFQLRSVVGGLISVTPILLTLVVNFGLMGFAGIPLDVATVLVGSIAIGVGIDYSIHFTNRFKEEFSQDNSDDREGDNKVPHVLRKTLETTGRAILINALAVMVGFLTLLLAEVVPLQRFGMLIAITMVASSVGAITFLPAVILLTKAKFIGNFASNKSQNKTDTAKQ